MKNTIVEFHHTKRTPALTNHIELNMSRLEHFSENIVSCHIIIALTQHTHHNSNLYNVKIILGLPGKELVVCHNNEENLYVGIQEAFMVMETQLKERMQRMHNHVKSHTRISHGKVVRLDYSEGFGFIEDAAGNEFYFNQNSVTNHHPLKQGDTVEFIEFLGHEGYQAHHIKATGYYQGELQQRAH